MLTEISQSPNQSLNVLSDVWMLTHEKADSAEQEERQYRCIGSDKGKGRGGGGGDGRDSNELDLTFLCSRMNI